jgi:hypothetical protein
MRNRFGAPLVVATGIAGVFAGMLVSGTPVFGQRPAAYRAPRSEYGDGKPNLNGIWQALTSANWNIEDHPAGPGYSNGPAWMLGALVAEPPGTGIVEGGTIPYQPAALQQRNDNRTKKLVADVYKEEGDPELRCYLPGLPRATYMPFPFQITQTPQYVNMHYQFANADRIVHMTNHQQPPVDSWMGWSNGRWDGDTLVIEVNGFNGRSWFDRAGNFMTPATKVTERYTPISPDHLQYEATIEDPAIYTRAWKIRLPLYRVKDANELLEFRCVEYSEEALYGRYTKEWKPFAWDPLTQMPAAPR